MEEMKTDYEKLKSDKPEIFYGAIRFLSETLGDSFWEWFEAATLWGNDTWFAYDRWHFSGGMNVRNHLRKNEFGEEFLGIDNLDDTYTFLVEDAYKMRTTNK